MYQALYRKYRPLLFSDVVGQTSIVKILKNSVMNNQVGHAYMFFGPRGTGKTSLAKIFARTINCQNLIEGEICCNCDSCKEMIDGKSVDIIEIDAASNNGVDEIRELRSKVSLVPNQLKYKVYIIDEVHMLSIGAFNALLKTLEEPPEHIVFILATTDPQKVPETIKSRCQCFNFKRISNFDIVEKLKKICELEQMNIEDKVLENIAIASNGGMRDSLSSLDMLYSACGKEITMEDYIEMNNLVDNSELNELLLQILNGTVDEFLNHIESMNSCGKNIIQIFELLLQNGRNIIVDYYTNNNRTSFEINIGVLEKFVFLLNEKIFDMKRASNPKIYIEIMVLKFINEELFDKNDREIISREIISKQMFDKKKKDDSLDSTVNNADFKEESKNDKNIQSANVHLKEDFDNIDSYDKIESDFLEKYKELMNIRINNTFCAADKTILMDVKEKFANLKEYVFDQNIGYLVCSLMDGTVRVASKDNILISLEYDSMIDANIKNMDKLKEVLNQVTGLTQNLAFITEDLWNIRKHEYIQKLQNGEEYQYIVEPELPVMKISHIKNELVDHAVELFGDIVEEEKI